VVVPVRDNPVLLVRYAYDPSRAAVGDGYLADIQTDIMIECCKFGKIKSVFLPVIESSSSWLNGCAFVTFLKDMDAKECAVYLHDRSFERRRLKVCLCLSKEESQKEIEIATLLDVAGSKLEVEEEVTIKMNAIEDDVEDFLNTLL
jgi:hypothetical protein